MNIKYSTSFTVMPQHANYMGMIFGGELLARMDIAAAECVRRLLYSTEEKLYSVTVGVNNVSFLVGALVGDLIFLECKVLNVGLKSITVGIVGYREKWENGEREKICSGEFSFVTKKEPYDTKGYIHNLREKVLDELSKEVQELKMGY